MSLHVSFHLTYKYYRVLFCSATSPVITHSSTGGSLKRPDTTESLNSSMSNGTNDAGMDLLNHEYFLN